MYPKFTKKLLFTSVVVVSHVAGLVAQVADDDDIIELSPFVVSADDSFGYLASNSTSGTRLAVPIKDLPVPVEVVTAAFMEDIGATDIESALAYSSGVYFGVFETAGSITTSDAGALRERSGSALSGSGAGFNNSAFIRGFRIDTQTRDGFRLGGSIPSQGISLGGITDSIMMQRIEVVKGPAALLYGVGVLSGVVNVIGKRPMPQESYEAGIRFGSDNYFRAEASATGPLAWGFNYRLGTSYQEREDWTDFWSDEKQVYFGQLEKKFFGNKLRLFMEASTASQLSEGIGFTGLRDNFGSRGSPVWNRGFHIPFRDRLQDRWDQPVDWVRDEDFGNKPASYRLSGPDTYRERDEWSALVDVEFEPIEKLVFKVGTYLTEQDMETVIPRAKTFSNNVYGSGLMRLYDGFVDPSNVFILDNPPSPLLSVVSKGVSLYGNRLQDTTLVGDNDHKSVGYWWSRNPITTKTTQVRAEATYSFDTSFLVGEAEHSFLVGYSYIKDTVTYPTGSNAGWVSGREILSDFNVNQTVVIPNFEDHPFRNPTDVSPIRYNGESISNIARNESETDVLMEGAYFVYTGKFFDEKLMLIAGVRRDSYNVHESIYSVDYFDFGEYNNPTVGVDSQHLYSGSGDRLGFVQELREGSSEANDFVDIDKKRQFDEDIVETSPTFAASYKLTDDISIFGLTSGGVLPNTGWKDGNDAAISPEVTRSYELGLKFDLGDRKLSGSISFFEINRENGVMGFSYAPRPNEWAGNSDKVVKTTFDPQGVIDGNYEITYGVRADYLPVDSYQLVIGRDENGNILRDENNKIIRSYYEGIHGVNWIWVAVDGDLENMHPDVREGLLNAFSQTRWTNNEVGPYFEEMNAAGQLTFQPLNWNPISYNKSPTNPNIIQNPSAINGGTNVIFEDQSTGLDLNLIYSPFSTQNFQIIFNYSHVEREITGMTFADPLHQNSGERFFTPLDSWVWYLGEDAFDESGDPQSFNGKGIEGKSMYFAPEDSANIWMKYTIAGGKWKNLSIAGGVSYSGPAATSVILGNPELDSNRFATPTTEERYKFDFALSYTKQFKHYNMRLALNVYNLLDDTHSLLEIGYPDLDNDGVAITRYRKTENFYGPRSYQFSTTFNF